MKYLYKLIILEKVNLFLLSVIMNTHGSLIAHGFFLNTSMSSSAYSRSTLCQITGRIRPDFFCDMGEVILLTLGFGVWGFFSA